MLLSEATNSFKLAPIKNRISLLVNILMGTKKLNSASIDQTEIEKFNRLASTWWDADGPMWPLHRLNQLRIGYITEQLVSHFDLDTNNNSPLSGLKVLDIGCGGGLLSEAIAARGASVHGVDIPEKNIAIAKQHAASLGNPPFYEQTTAEDLQQRGEQYDVLLNMEVVEHVANLDSFMTACNSLVKPGGLQIVSTINRNPIAWFSAIVGAEYVLKWLPKGTHQYRKLVRPGELLNLCKRDGLEPVNSTGVFVNPITRKMSLRRSKSISYMIVFHSKQ